jgi:hypothetical protein
MFFSCVVPFRRKKKKIRIYRCHPVLFVEAQFCIRFNVGQYGRCSASSSIMWVMHRFRYVLKSKNSQHVHKRSKAGKIFKLVINHVPFGTIPGTTYEKVGSLINLNI